MGLNRDAVVIEGCFFGRWSLEGLCGFLWIRQEDRRPEAPDGKAEGRKSSLEEAWPSLQNNSLHASPPPLRYFITHCTS